VRAPSRRIPTPDVAANELPQNVLIKKQILLRVKQFQTNEILNLKNIELIIFLKDAEFYLAGSMRNETKVLGRILLGDNRGGRAITLRRIEFQRVGVCVSTGLRYINTTADQTYTQFRIAPYLPQISHKSRSA
jgi:hypothetical protein